MVRPSLWGGRSIPFVNACKRLLRGSNPAVLFFHKTAVWEDFISYKKACERLPKRKIEDLYEAHFGNRNKGERATRLPGGSYPFWQPFCLMPLPSQEFQFLSLNTGGTAVLGGIISFVSYYIQQCPIPLCFPVFKVKYEKQPGYSKKGTTGKCRKIRIPCRLSWGAYPFAKAVLSVPILEK